MITLRARWVLPISSPPIADGWVAANGNRIAAIGRNRRHLARDQGGGTHQVDLGRVVLLPGLVNAHTHVELSYLRGLVDPAPRFTSWIRHLMALRRQQPVADAPHIVQAARAAVDELRAWGTALVGDVGNTGISVPLLAQAGLPAAAFFELLRFRSADADAVFTDAVRRLADLAPPPHVRVGLAPHAPYSVSPRLFQLIRRERDRSRLARTSVHVGESAEEQELLQSGGGPWRDLLADLGAWDSAWAPPGCGAVEYLDRMRVLDHRTLVVHAVQSSPSDVARLAARGSTVVTCPRSNRHVGVGDAPLAAFYDGGVHVAVGTDSLASAPDLGVWGELREMRRIAPAVPAARLLESATLVGAKGLGFGDDYGSIEPGKVAALIAVSIPAGVRDIEEHLVSGIDRDAVSWVSEADPAAHAHVARTTNHGRHPGPDPGAGTSHGPGTKDTGSVHAREGAR